MSSRAGAPRMIVRRGTGGQEADEEERRGDGKIKAPPPRVVQVAGFVRELEPAAMTRRRRSRRIFQRIQRRMRWQQRF
jgi:hypothetical protein